MIELQGGILPFICLIFVIFFGGFMSLKAIFDKNFMSSLGMASVEAVFVGRTLGFSIMGSVLILIAVLLGIGPFTSVNEVLGVIFIFTGLSVINNLLMYMKVIPAPNEDYQLKNAIRPLIPFTVILIRALII